MECMWCLKDASLDVAMVHVCTLKTGSLYLHRDQTHRGRCIFAYREHVQKITQLTKDEFLRMMEDIYVSIDALTEVCRPQKINMLILGDKASHMHIHLCPKYEGEKDWGDVFPVNEPIPIHKTETEMHDLARAIKETIIKWEKC